MVEQSPVQLAISDQLPQRGTGTVCSQTAYDFVRNGMDETTTICAIAREQAHASFDTVGSGYYRQAYAGTELLCRLCGRQRCGLDTAFQV